jgi:hypothetical protein
MRRNCLPVFVYLLAILLAMPVVQAATVTVSQSGADSGTIMKGRAFTIAVSDLSGSGTVNLIDTPTGFSSGEGTSKAFSSGTTSVSWTTTSISQAQTNTKITVQVSGTGSPSTAESSNFNVILPPSITLSVSPSSASVSAGSTYTVSLNMQNSGETSAQSVAISVSGTGMSVSSGCSTTSSIPAGSSSSVSCTVATSSSLSTNTYSAQFTATPSNADPKSESISVTVTGVTTPGDGTTGPSSPWGGAPANNASRRPALVPGVGLRNNTKLQSAIEKVLAKGKLSEQAFENLMRLSESITSDLEVGRHFNISAGKSLLSMRMTYRGERPMSNFIVHDVLPKAFAQHTDNITVNAPGATVEIAEEDPEYIFLYPALSSGQEIVITYSIDGEVSSSVIDSVDTWVYAESYNPDGTAWYVIEECEYGCENNACKPAPAGEEAGPIAFDYIWIIAVVIIVAVIAGLLYYYRKKIL